MNFIFLLTGTTQDFFSLEAGIFVSHSPFSELQLFVSNSRTLFEKFLLNFNTALSKYLSDLFSSYQDFYAKFYKYS